MALFDAMLSNYPHRRHFLQTVNLPAFDPPGSRFFVYEDAQGRVHNRACNLDETARGGKEYR